MKTTFDVLDIFYVIINKPSITSLLSGGKVYRNGRPVTSKGKDIVLNILPIESGVDIDLQRGTIIINIFAKDVIVGIPDETSLRAISAQVLSTIYLVTATNQYLDIEVTSQTVMGDMDNVGVSYSSIRIDYAIEFGHVPELLPLQGSSNAVFTASGSLT